MLLEMLLMKRKGLQMFRKADEFFDRIRSNNIARRIILAVCMIVFVYSMYNIISTLVDYRRSKIIYEDVRSKFRNHQYIEDGQSSSPYSLTEDIPDNTFRSENNSQSNSPSGENTNDSITSNQAEVHEEAALQGVDTEQQKLVFKGLEEIKKINPDVVAWINIKDTNIDYPILQGKDNDFYLKHNIYKEKSRAASIFMDYRNNAAFEDQNTILYGHNMKDGSMFRDLLYYEQPWFFKKHKIINIETAKGTLKYEVFSVYVTDVNFNYLITNFDNEKEYEDFLNIIKEKSKVKSDVAVSAKDKIITLSTCSYQFKNARTVVHAKLAGK